jgi:flagellar biosynthesis chaperone FliJ
MDDSNYEVDEVLGPENPDNLYRIDVSAHLKMQIATEVEYEEFVDKLNALVDEYRNHPENGRVQIQACDENPCFNPHCEMNQRWKVR